MMDHGRQGAGVRRRLVLAVALAGLPGMGARAQDAGPLPVVRAFATALEGVMRAGKARPFRERFDSLAPAIDRTFDLPTILAVSVGARWATLDEAVRAQLLDVFRVYTISSYVANFDSGDAGRIEVSPDLRAVGADQVVRTRVFSGAEEGVRLDYVMRRFDTGWRAVDVLADGTISRVAVQRSDFRALLGRDTNTAALIGSLRRKIADLSGGALA